MTFDYIIAGAGSAGCILANRLTEDPNTSVLLVEAGGTDHSLFIRMPTALSYPMNTRRLNWFYHSEPEPGLEGRSLHCPRGKVLGGSSSINGMVFVRGHACDYEEWEEMGAEGWHFRACLPYFKRLESWMGGSNDFRGGTGPIAVNNGNNMQLNPLYQAFIKAGEQAGYPTTEDYNGYQQEGFGPMQMNIDSGVRASTARAYLRPARQRRNLQVLTHSLVDTVLFDGKRAIGLRLRRHGKVMDYHAKGEVLLAAGSIGSPTILQRSGVGDPGVLAEAGVAVLHPLAGVGENLRDHLEVYLQYRCKQPISLNGRLGLMSKGLIGARWLVSRSGLGATNHFESCGFIRSAAGVKWPDIQYHFLPAAMRYDGHAAFNGHGFQVHVGPTKSRSTGFVRIRDRDPASKPQICFNYLSHPDDVPNWRRAIRLTREIFQQPAMADFKGDEIQPGEALQSDEELDGWVRNNVESAYHPCGTCKIGSEGDPYAVLDSHCRVRGLDGLRVIDSSVFPSIPNGNLNAPTMMVAERVAASIMQQELAPAQVDYWLDPEWENRQRLNPQ